MRTIEIYDTTLRDGSQGEGVNFPLEDKLATARQLAEAGVDYVECGYRLSNPNDAQFFERVRGLNLGLPRRRARCRCRARSTASASGAATST